MRSALNTLDGIKNIETNTKDQSCSFVAPANLDVAAALDKFAAEGNEHIKGWSKADEAAADDSRDEDEAEEDEEDDADGDAAATASKAGTQTVSLKLPGMT